MEVHHHAHTSGKKWTHYIWEFLMLFLAVFCGFLAENFREHQVEHQRERQYMITMLEDLRADTSLLHTALDYWNERNKSVDSVAEAIQIPVSKIDFNKVYRHFNRALDYYSFKYNDRTIAQLKNAGGFRLIREKEVANKIIAYDQFINDAVVNIAAEYHQFYMNVVGLMNKAFVQEIINRIHEKYQNNLPPYSDKAWIDNMINTIESPYTDRELALAIFEFKNALLSFRNNFSNMNWGYTHLLKYQEELISLIAKKYHLK
jgi:hypothetical protein